MMSTPIRSCRSAGVLGALCLMFAGCGATYQVTVRNDGSRSVRAKMVHNPLLRPQRTLGAGTVSPLTSVDWSARGIDPFDPVHVEILAAGDTQGMPEKIDLPRGASTVVIEDAGASSWSGFSLRIER